MYSLNSLSVMLKSRCMEKSQAKGIESQIRPVCQYHTRMRCMEKSQAKGIERNQFGHIPNRPHCRCMEKSQAKGIESLGGWGFFVDVWNDAWKNPKQRELKVNYTEHFNNFIVG